MTITLALFLGVLLDRLFGELPRWHPLVGFGRCADWLERRLNRSRARISRGLLGWTLLVLPPSLLALWAARLPQGWIIDAIALYFALGARALGEHGAQVTRAL